MRLRTNNAATRKVGWNEPVDDPIEALGNAQYVLQNQKVEEEDYDDGELNAGELSDDDHGDKAAGQPGSSKRPARAARSKKRARYAEDEEDVDDWDVEDKVCYVHLSSQLDA